MPINDSSKFVEKENRYVTRVKLAKTFKSFKDVVEYTMDDEKMVGPDGVFDPTTNIKGEKISDTIIEAQLGRWKESLGSKRRDTSVGGNDAVNCYYQFNENDDIVHPINSISGFPGHGLGRVYNEVFDEQQQLLHISFGVADFTSIFKFMETLFDKDMALLQNTGDYGTIRKISLFLGQALGIIVKLPFYPIKWALDFLTSSGINAPSKYYDFKPTMALYYQHVNVILAHLGVNMDLAPTEGAGLGTEGMPELLRTHGMDILTILSKKSSYDGLKGADKITLEEMVEALEVDPDYSGNRPDHKIGFWEGLKKAETEAMLYVGFRIEKSVDSSESASNATKESALTQMVNAKVSQQKELAFNLGGLMNAGMLGTVLTTIKDGIMGVAEGVTDIFKIQGGMEVLKGSGFIDIPEVWASSSFSKSYSFNFQLRTPYGNKFSIFYSLYIPLALLMAGAFPRAVGANSYTSPFLVRAYSKGMFAIPMGIIDSITIKRGGAEYGWSVDSLPTCIDVSFSVKDLSPLMYVALAGNSKWDQIFGQNSSFQEYLLTLSGVGIAERTLAGRLLKKRAAAVLKIASNNTFNATSMGFRLGNSKIGRAAAAFSISRLPGFNDR